MVDDLLSDVLAMVRLSGALIFRANVQGTWCISAHCSLQQFAPALPSGTNHLIAFHVVLHGRCWVRVPSGKWEPVEAGEAVVLPHGDAHEIGDHRSDAPVAIESLLGDQHMLELRDQCFDTGPGATTRLLCGFLGCDKTAFTPLFASLPSKFIARFDAGTEALLNYAVAEIVSDNPGSRGMQVRMAELLFLESLRDYMRKLPNDALGWLAGLNDPLVGRALQMLHADPAQAWNVETLARRAASSRSLLAQRFKIVIGQTPMQYLTHLRMQRAAQRLVEGRCSIEAVAEEVGYSSAAAFQRAFKRCRGTPPAQWRRTLSH